MDPHVKLNLENMTICSTNASSLRADENLACVAYTDYRFMLGHKALTTSVSVPRPHGALKGLTAEVDRM